MPARKKSRIGYRRKYSVPSGTHHKRSPVLKVDDAAAESDAFFSKPLDFFLSDNFSLVDTNANSDPVEYVDSDGFSANEFIVCLDKPYQYSPDVVLEDFVRSNKCRIFSELRESCKRELKTWYNFIYMTNSSDMKYVELYDSNEHWETPRVKTCVSVNKDLKVNIMVHGKSLPDSHSIYEKVGRFCYSVRCVQKVLDVVSQYHICQGNQDSELQNVIPVGDFVDVSEGYRYQGYRESFYIQSTIRSTKCDFFVRKNGSRCFNCQTYRRTLRKTLFRRSSTPYIPPLQKDWTKCKTSNKNLTENQKLHKIKQLRDYIHQLELENARLKRKIKRKINTEGDCVSERESNDFSELMQNCENEVKK